MEKDRTVFLQYIPLYFIKDQSEIWKIYRNMKLTKTK